MPDRHADREDGADQLHSDNGSSRTMSASLRLRWEYRPGSELFAVCSDGRNASTGSYPDLLTQSVALRGTRLLRF